MRKCCSLVLERRVQGKLLAAVRARLLPRRLRPWRVNRRKARLIRLIAWAAAVAILVTVVRMGAPPSVLPAERAHGYARWPLDLRGDTIYVQVNLDGQPATAVLDTGSACTLLPAVADPTASWLGEGVFTDRAGISMMDQAVIVGNLSLGGYEVSNFPAMRYGTADIGSGGGGAGFFLLGNSAFEQCVVTIDILHKYLIVRYAGAGAPCYRPSAGAVRLPFRWVEQGAAPGTPGVPAVPCELNGRQSLCVFDTGAGSLNLAVTEEAAQRIQGPGGKDRAADTMEWASVFGQTTEKTIDKVSLSLTQPRQRVHSLVLEGRAIVWQSLSGADAAFSCASLREFRITIDYPRKMIYLEPYEGDRFWSAWSQTASS